MNPEKAYQQQAYNARQRGISFELTFEQWWNIWEKWFHMRGRGKNALCMARHNDTGPYAAGNVYLTTNLGNALDVDPSKRKIPAPKKLSDDERIERQSRKERWGKASRASSNDRASHLSYKAHCRDTDDYAIDRDSEAMAE